MVSIELLAFRMIYVCYIHEDAIGELQNFTK